MAMTTIHTTGLVRPGWGVGLCRSVGACFLAALSDCNDVESESGVTPAGAEPVSSTSGLWAGSGSDGRALVIIAPLVDWDPHARGSAVGLPPVGLSPAGLSPLDANR